MNPPSQFAPRAAAFSNLPDGLANADLLIPAQGTVAPSTPEGHNSFSALE